MPRLFLIDCGIFYLRTSLEILYCDICNILYNIGFIAGNIDIFTINSICNTVTYCTIGGSCVLEQGSDYQTLRFTSMIGSMTAYLISVHLSLPTFTASGNFP